MFSAQNFPVKIEIQNSVSEFARRYGTPAADIGNDIGKRGRKREPTQQRQRVAWSNGERPQGDRASASSRLLPRR